MRDSNSREAQTSNGFQDRRVMTTSLTLRVKARAILTHLFGIFNTLILRIDTFGLLPTVLVAVDKINVIIVIGEEIMSAKPVEGVIEFVCRIRV